MVVLHDEVADWIDAQDRRTRNRILDALHALGEVGPGLGRPLVDSVAGSRFSNMKELRVGSCRLLFAFDPRRRAVVLVGGDKRDQWVRWYREAIPVADGRLADWLADRERD